MRLDFVDNVDCFSGMAQLPDASIDLILCDPPYGSTACAWDSILDLERMWAEYRRILKPTCAVVLTSSQPFTTILIASNMRAFRYSWVWNKRKPGNIFLAKSQPMKIHEDICVFGFDRKAPRYFPVMVPRERSKVSRNYGTGAAFARSLGTGQTEPTEYRDKYPQSIIDVSNADQRGKIHPTQKPVPLMEYLIRTYSLPGDVVLDNCMGSFTTAVACLNTGRHFVGYESDASYWTAGQDRLNSLIDA